MCCNYIEDTEHYGYLLYYSNYVLYYILFNLRKYFNSIAQGAAQQNISKTKVDSKIILIPPKKLVDDFDSIVVPIRSQIKNFSKCNKNLKGTRDFLLPKLISGKVDVSELDIDTSILDD